MPSPSADIFKALVTLPGIHLVDLVDLLTGFASSLNSVLVCTCGIAVGVMFSSLCSCSFGDTGLNTGLKDTCPLGNFLAGCSSGMDCQWELTH